MRKLFGTVTLVFASFSTLFASGEPEADEMFRIAATTSIVGDVVSKVAGPEIPLTVLLEPGIDPHSYEPAPLDMAEIEKAQLLFVNGFELEEQLLRSLENVSGGRIAEVSRIVDPLELSTDGDDKNDDHGDDIDPHTWMSPKNVLLWVDVIEEELISANPVRRDVYEYNAQVYRNALTALDASFTERLSIIPRDKRILITDHASLGYFARDYGFSVRGSIIPGFSSTSEPSAADIVAAAEAVRETGVPVIFIGSSAGERVRDLAEAVAEEAGTSVEVRTLLTGALAAEGEPGDTYISFMEYNIEQILAGFGI